MPTRRTREPPSRSSVSASIAVAIPSASNAAVVVGKEKVVQAAKAAATASVDARRPNREPCSGREYLNTEVAAVLTVVAMSR